jgi:hypothetical protein
MYPSLKDVSIFIILTKNNMPCSWW